jgi:hypothetical protein
MPRNPFIHALSAASYIVLIVFLISSLASPDTPDSNLLIPMTMLSLLVLSVAVMGYLFFYEPVRLYVEGQKEQSVAFFGKTVGYFACFAAFLLAALHTANF